MKIVFEDIILQRPEKLFPWIADPGKAMKWQKNVKGGEILTRNPDIVGTTFKEVIEEDGNSLEMSGTITKYEKDRVIGFHISSRIHRFDVLYNLEDWGNSTRFTIDSDIRWKFPMNVICLFIRKRIEKKLRKQLETEIQDLKILCTDSKNLF
jgi:hypothetical protein